MHTRILMWWTISFIALTTLASIAIGQDRAQPTVDNGATPTCWNSVAGLAGDERRSKLIQCLAAERSKKDIHIPRRKPSSTPKTAAVTGLNPWDIEHNFVGTDIPSANFRVMVASHEYDVAVRFSVSVGEPECYGYFFGIGRIKTYTVVLSPYPIPTEAATCKVTLNFNQAGTEADVKQTDSCNYFHGGRCNFEGRFVRASP
jgi:hypothetical protein